MICFEKRLLGNRVKMYVYFFQSGVKKGRRAEKSVKAPPAPEFEPSGNDSPQPQAAAVVCFCFHFYNVKKKNVKNQIQESFFKNKNVICVLILKICYSFRYEKMTIACFTLLGFLSEKSKMQKCGWFPKDVRTRETHYVLCTM